MKTYVKFIVILIVFIGCFISCKTQPDNATDDEVIPHYTSEQLLNKLIRATADSIHADSLDLFFSEWNRYSKPYSIDSIAGYAVDEAIYSLYKVFYSPFNLTRLGDPEWGNRLNEGAGYAVIQSKVYYQVLSTDDFQQRHSLDRTRMDSLTDFRPSLDIAPCKALYLTDEYKTAIEKYLGMDYSEVGTGDIMNPAMPKDKSRDHYQILRNYIPVLMGHWGGYWHIETHPYVFYIILNKDLSKALVNFRIGYQGGETILEKRFRTWSIVESGLTWIE